VLHIGSIAISSHVAAFFIAFCITFPIGFYLSMFVVFQGSYLRKRIQLVRYFAVALVCIFLNYVLLKLFVDSWGWYPTPSLMLTALIVITFSYLSQKHFSFKKEKLEIDLK
jgi:putative flippase GtrA